MDNFNKKIMYRARSKKALPVFFIITPDTMGTNWMRRDEGHLVLFGLKTDPETFRMKKVSGKGLMIFFDFK